MVGWPHMGAGSVMRVGTSQAHVASTSLEQELAKSVGEKLRASQREYVLKQKLEVRSRWRGVVEILPARRVDVVESCPRGAVAW